MSRITSEFLDLLGFRDNELMFIKEVEPTSMLRIMPRFALVDEFHNQTPTNLPTISRSLERISIV
jgi:hypothetical protein